MTNATYKISAAKGELIEAVERLKECLRADCTPNTDAFIDHVNKALSLLGELQAGGLPPKPGEMSVDRVSLVIPERYLRVGAVERAMNEAFGLRPEEIRALKNKKDHYGNDGVQVICRPSQFARFIILRNEYGGNNSIKDLQPELFQPAIVAEPLDVSKRKNQHDAPAKEI